MNARVAIYPFKRLFVVGAVSTDVQSGQATMCYLPGIETPERECWYINLGAVDKSFFTTYALCAQRHANLLVAAARDLDVVGNGFRRTRSTFGVKPGSVLQTTIRASGSRESST